MLIRQSKCHTHARSICYHRISNVNSRIVAVVFNTIILQFAKVGLVSEQRFPRGVAGDPEGHRHYFEMDFEMEFGECSHQKPNNVHTTPHSIGMS